MYSARRLLDQMVDNYGTSLHFSGFIWSDVLRHEFDQEVDGSIWKNDAQNVRNVVYSLG